MKLYMERYPAPNPRRVQIFLAEKGLSIPVENVPLRERAHKTPEFKQKNSLGQLPVLELADGSTLSESVSICRYLDELNPGTPMFGRTALERAQVDMWIRRIEFTLMNPIAAVWVNAHPLTAPLGTKFKDYGEASRSRVAAAMAWFDRELVGRRTVVTDHFTMADVVALTTIDFARFVGMDMPTECEHLRAWHAGVSARASVLAR